MKCPYCLSDIEDEALVCKVCTRDLYLLKPLLEKISKLEGQLAAVADPASFDERIRDLEQQLASAHERLHPVRTGPLAFLFNLTVFILLPLGLLLLSHWLITIALDTSLLYLRIISIAVPLPFGLVLFLRRRRAVLPWFVGTVFLAIASVIGMSWITSLVDNTPVLPQNAFEWREYLEYAASISFSFLTGMLLGGVLNSRSHRPAGKLRDSLLRSIVSRLVGGNLTPQQLGTLIKKLEEYGSSIVAVGTTAVSIYTGLKGVLGS